MWVWVAMRCFFDVDCTSSILIAATARRRRFLRAVCVSLSPAAKKFGSGGEGKEGASHK